MDADASEVARKMLEVIPAVMSTIRSEMRSRRRSDLSVMQFRTLVYLNLYPGTSLSALAEYLGLTLPTVSQMINGLVEKGVVNRVDSSTDRRRVMLSLTEPGKALLDRSLIGTQARLAEILLNMEAEDIRAVQRVMQLFGELFCQPQSNNADRAYQQP
jgi:DNA-binding MarR family transcriptional regulator